MGFFPSESGQSIKPLIAMLNDSVPEVRRSAILALGKLGKNEHGVLDALKKFQTDPDDFIKLNAAIAAANINKPDESSIPILMKAVSAKDQTTSKQAARVLGGYAAEHPDKVLPQMVELLERKEQPGFSNALRVLRLMKSSAMPALPKVINLYDKGDSQERADMVDAVVAIDAQGDYAIPVLVKALKEPDPMDRKEALMNMIRYRAKADQYITAVSDSLSDSDVDNKLLAIGIIRGLGEKGTAAVPKLAALLSDNDVRIRSSAVSALGSFPPSPDLMAALDKGIQDSDYRVRGAAIAALKRVGTADKTKAVSILQQASDREQHEGTKRAITSALDSLKNPPK